jgi:F-type H+-transporting ATPase subunit b
MSVNWFTVAAQVVNFLILIWLLHRFLYGPIIAAMDRRERRIAERLQDAQRKCDTAEAEAAAFRRQREDLNAERDRLLAEARREAETLRSTLIEAARAEMVAQQADWRSDLEREQEGFLAALRRQTQQEFLTLARRALADLANASLEGQVVAVFLDKLGDLDPPGKDALRAALREGNHSVLVRSRFQLPPALRHRVTKAIHEHIAADAKIAFETAENQRCGIELRSDSHVLGWSIDGYLDAIERHLSLHRDRSLAAADAGGAAP